MRVFHADGALTSTQTENVGTATTGDITVRNMGDAEKIQIQIEGNVTVTMTTDAANNLSVSTAMVDEIRIFEVTNISHIRLVETGSTTATYDIVGTR